MTTILGLDLGTNSIGWAIVEEYKGKFSLKDKGVRIFPEGVKNEQGKEISKAAERTSYRSVRRLKFRRKLRKIETLKALSEFDFCPALTTEELNSWRYQKIYPQNEAFRSWWLTGDHTNTPYYFRNLAVTEPLNLKNQRDRFKIGRALYHIAQRRGFLSNRLDTKKESDGEVYTEIQNISEAKGDKTLGQYFYQKYLHGEKIRNHYTHREEHYLQEFQKICEVQQLSDEFATAIHRAIFYQRPLKSQKGLVGKCVFEPKKPRCAVSRPEFEEFRMLSFVNNIKIQTPSDDKMRFLTDAEREKIVPLFFRKSKSKEQFDFEDIAKKLAPNKRYRFSKDTRSPGDHLFNFHMKTTVSGCPVSARFKTLFGDDFMEVRFEYTREKDKKVSCIDIHDIWHVLNTFDSEKKLADFARKRIQLNEEQVGEFTKFNLKQEYTSLSLKSINKILPFLRQGLIYSHAVFLANMENVIPPQVWEKEENKQKIRKEIQTIISRQNEDRQIAEVVNTIIKNIHDAGSISRASLDNNLLIKLVERLKNFIGRNRYNSFDKEKQKRLKDSAITLLEEQLLKNRGLGEFVKLQRIEERIKAFINGMFGVEPEALNRLYHPSAMEVFKAPSRENDGRLYLNSPMVSSIRNPMAMRALHQLRKVINELIKNDLVDSSTKIHIEMARDLKNANERKALQAWQQKRARDRAEYAQKIKEHFDEVGISREPSETEILKYQLWEEQKHICVYTGEQIGIVDFLEANAKYDIEHTIPRSLALDNSQENKTLCESRFNRHVKRNRIPSELDEHADILASIEPWKNRYEKLEKDIEKARRASRSAVGKEKKDQAIQRRHKLTYERDYWRNKYQRFEMWDVPTGFKNSQIVDTGIITKYSRMYLNTVFQRVYTVKGRVVADFRKMWGLQDNYTQKERVSHIHHCIDAITIACITKENYERLARFYHDQENAFIQGANYKPSVKKPWPTFTEDMKEVERQVLISSYSPNVLAKQSKKKLRIRGRVQKDKTNNPIYQQGDTVRGSLHKETFYGAIERTITNKKGEEEKQIKYVIRKPLVDLKLDDIKNIVDDRVREIVTSAKAQEKKLTKNLVAIKKQLEKADKIDQTEKQQQVNELENQLQNLYVMPNKNGSPIPIKKVRLFQPSVTNPLHIKKQRDTSRRKPKPHKEHYHVVNDSNYIMAIYEGKNHRGKTVRDFHLVNNFDAGRFFRPSMQRKRKEQQSAASAIVSNVKYSGKTELALKALLTAGKLVLFWENTSEEVFDLPQKELVNRLYKTVAFEADGRIQFRIHQTAMQQSSTKKEEMTIKKHMQENNLSNSKVNFINPVPWLRLSKTAWNFLIEGIDFNLTPLGKIERLN